MVHRPGERGLRHARNLRGLCPGTYDEKYASLACDYLELCDDEHSGIQGNFVAAYIGKYGFSEVGAKVFLAGVASTQELPPNECYGAAVATEDVLRRLLEARDGLQEYHWQATLYALWGDDAVHEKGAQTIKKAPPHLKLLYEAIFEKKYGADKGFQFLAGSCDGNPAVNLQIPSLDADVDVFCHFPHLPF